MTWWSWVLLFAVIVLGGLLVLALLGLSVWRKAKLVGAETRRAGAAMAELQQAADAAAAARRDRVRPTADI